MAMTAGSVSVAANGSVTKSGMAEALYDALIAELDELPAGAEGVPHKSALALQCTALATGLVGYLTTNAQAKIPSATGGLQKTPDPNDPNTATAGPGADKFLEIV